MAAIPPPPQNQPFSTESGRISPIWLHWLKKFQNAVATSVDSPGADNFASLDANGNIQDSGYDNTSFVTINGDTMTGQLEFSGDGRYWDHSLLKPGAVKLPGANPPNEDNIDNFPFHRYDRTTEESVFYLWEVPGNYISGTANVRGHYDFVISHPPAVNEVVAMGFEYKKVSDGEVFSFTAGTSSGYILETITTTEAAYTMHSTNLGYPDTTGWVAGDKILFRFYRDATNPLDTFDSEAVGANNDVWVFIYAIEWLCGSLGEAT